MKKGHHLQPHSFIDSSNLLCPFIKLTMAENIPIINHICLRANNNQYYTNLHQLLLVTWTLHKIRLLYINKISSQYSIKMCIVYSIISVSGTYGFTFQ